MRPMTELVKRARCIEHGEDGGAFVVRSPKHANLRVIASWSGGWDHVSVTLATRCPTWAEMCLVKAIFFKPDEVAMQLHVAEADHIDCHPYCLHLWRPQGGLNIGHGGAATLQERIDAGQTIPLPPKVMV